MHTAEYWHHFNIEHFARLLKIFLWNWLLVFDLMKKWALTKKVKLGRFVLRFVL